MVSNTNEIIFIERRNGNEAVTTDEPIKFKKLFFYLIKDNSLKKKGETSEKPSENLFLFNIF